MGRDWLRGGDAGERENLEGMISQVIFFYSPLEWGVVVVKVYQEPSGGPWTPLLATFSFFTTAAQSTPNPCWLVPYKGTSLFFMFYFPQTCNDQDALKLLGQKLFLTSWPLNGSLPRPSTNTTLGFRKLLDRSAKTSCTLIAVLADGWGRGGFNRPCIPTPPPQQAAALASCVNGVV